MSKIFGKLAAVRRNGKFKVCMLVAGLRTRSIFNRVQETFASSKIFIFRVRQK